MTLYRIKKQKDKDLALKLAIRVLKNQVFEAEHQIRILEGYIGDKRTKIERFFCDGSPIITRSFVED